MSRFTDYMDRYRAGATHLIWRVEAISQDGDLLATDDENDVAGDVQRWAPEISPISLSGGRSQRLSTMTLPSVDGSFLPVHGSPLDPDARNRIRVYAGVSSGVDDTDKSYWPHGTFYPDEIDAVYEGGVVTMSIGMVDSTSPLDSELTTGFDFEQDEPVEDVVSRIVAQVVAGASITPTGFVTPVGSFAPKMNRLELVDQLLGGCGHELVATPLGKLISRAIPPSTGDPSSEFWVYGDNGIPCARVNRLWRSANPQGVLIEGGSFATADISLQVAVWDTDPASLGFYGGPGIVRFPSRQFPFIETRAQAVEAGYAVLRREGIGPMTVDFDSVPNPAMREQDLVEITIDALNVDGLFRVVSIDLPVHADGLMTVRARAVFNPSIGYNPAGVGYGSGCLVSFSDNFDREDQNLENLVGQPGSEDWTEYGYSWGVEGGRAVQRYPNGWSMAMPRSPLCSSDHSMTLNDLLVPSGRQIGPMVRSSGQFDGYAALANSSGRVSLEFWQSGQRVRTIGAYDHGGSLDGQNLTLSASGSTISVDVGSDEVISVSDDTGKGSYVGMLAYGGHGSAAPSTDEVSGVAV